MEFDFEDFFVFVVFYFLVSLLTPIIAPFYFHFDKDKRKDKYLHHSYYPAFIHAVTSCVLSIYKLIDEGVYNDGENTRLNRIIVAVILISKV